MLALLVKFFAVAGGPLLPMVNSSLNAHFVIIAERFIVVMKHEGVSVCKGCYFFANNQFFVLFSPICVHMVE